MMSSGLKSSPVLTSALLLAASVAAACTATDEPEVESLLQAPAGALSTSATTQPRPITEAEIQEIQASPGYRDMLDVLADNGSAVQLAKGSVFTYERRPTEIEILFRPTDAAGNPDRQFAEMVYQRVAGIRSPFYFTPHGAEGAAALSPAQGSAQGCEPASEAAVEDMGKPDEGDVEILGCSGWSSWTITHTACEARFWCFGKGQVGLFSYRQRTRVCNWGTQLATRRDFVRCGC